MSLRNRYKHHHHQQQQQQHNNYRPSVDATVAVDTFAVVVGSSIGVSADCSASRKQANETNISTTTALL